MAYVKIFGIASNRKIIELPIPIIMPETLTLMDFLIQHNITIASSCGGEGICSRCIVNQDILSCQITLKDFVSSNPNLKIDIAYL